MKTVKHYTLSPQSLQIMHRLQSKYRILQIYHNTYVFLCRYIELVYPIWHKIHFKMRYIYISLVFVWIFDLVPVAHMIPTGKVSKLYKLLANSLS